MNARFDVVCFSHLRWGFVHQRPQHLLSRCARSHRVFFVEEPVFGGDSPALRIQNMQEGVWAVVPVLPKGMDPEHARDAERLLLGELFFDYEIRQYVLWYYTPMAVSLTRHLTPVATVYDCMDELSAFAGASKEVREREGELFDSADLVFAGGRSLFEAKRTRHPHVHLFPSSVDAPHFSQARGTLPDPADQREVPHPRVGFFGVIDERMDLELLRRVSELRPDWHLVMVGPVAKIDPDTLPRRPNIHYLGQKSYEELPAYLSGWDVAMLPFALNDSTRFISPTKTPEYLAAGKPVVSTPIADVVRPYGEQGLVRIADTPEAFVDEVEGALQEDADERTERVDRFLAPMSWDGTWARMEQLIQGVIDSGRREATSRSHLHPKAFDYLIVGAGFAGSVLAERLASGAGKRVLVVDRRNHVGGNAYDHHDDSGLLVHRYGPHIFHTNSWPVFRYLSHFTKWRPYEHRVLTSVEGLLLPMPINLDTINTLYGMNLDAFQLEAFFASVAEPIDQIRTSEDVVVSKVGRDLYEKFFRGYTRKQWGLDPSELDASVTARVPTRSNRDPRYFTDKYQAMPVHGYTRMFQNMLGHPNIKVMLNTDYEEVADLVPFHQLIFTGRIDEFFGFRYGTLPYRSLDFSFETLDEELHQPAPVVNHPNEHAYTRVTEFKYLTGQRHPKTTLVYEYPKADGDPYYPVPRAENQEMYRNYKAVAQETPGVHFVGRLATYKYYNMDQVVAQALAVFNRLMRGADGQVEEGGEDLDAIVSLTDRAVGRDRVHREPGGEPLFRSTGS